MNIRLALLYVAFAVVATLVNIGVQRLSIAAYEGPYFLAAAIFAGTLVGLVVKYVLDKKWIFHDVGTSAAKDSKQFVLYALMGVITTAIFWGSEAASWMIWKTHSAREIGAVIGLTIGYVVKYQLDRRFVFGRAQPQMAGRR